MYKLDALVGSSQGRLSKATILFQRQSVNNIMDMWNLLIETKHSEGSRIIVDFLDDFVIFKASTLHPVFVES